jgi:hypothetical protein
MRRFGQTKGRHIEGLDFRYRVTLKPSCLPRRILENIMGALATLIVIAMVVLISRLHRLSAYKTVRNVSVYGGLMHCELRRRTLLDTGVPGSYPLPREERLRVWTIAGVPVRVIGLGIGLPTWLDARIDQVDATEFDGSFDPEFSMGGNAN